eukprot:m.99009 g.99009  ORF g.99009 m.99009 type:complete len:599 (+) comp15572_c0_seq1:237-2033(+)
MRWKLHRALHFFGQNMLPTHSDMRECMHTERGSEHKRDITVKWILVALAVVLGFVYADYLLPPAAVLLALLDAQVMILWACFVGCVLFGLLALLLSMVVVTPLQFLPAPLVDSRKQHKWRTFLLFGLVFLYSFLYWHADYHMVPRLLLGSLLGLLAAACGWLGIAARSAISALVVKNLVLPALSVSNMAVILPNGRRGTAMQAAETVRAHTFINNRPLVLPPDDDIIEGSISPTASSSSNLLLTNPSSSSSSSTAAASSAAASNSSSPPQHMAAGGAGAGGPFSQPSSAAGSASRGLGRNSMSGSGSSVNNNNDKAVGWRNVKLPGGGFAIDAAYLVHPAQAELVPAQQRWVLWFLGNGELYEFLIPELQTFAAVSGLNVMAFNFRGVGHSEGQPSTASDLVNDGRVVLEYLCTELGARPNHVLFFGHSLGGAVAALLRCDSSPDGPIVNERSFSTLGAAAQAVLAIVVKSFTGTKLRLPVSLVQGLLNSVFKGRLDVVSAWQRIAGPKLVVYHDLDELIVYRDASLHAALQKHGLLANTRSILLSNLGKADYHNCPLNKFPEYNLVLSACREMLGLPSTLPAPDPTLSGLDGLHGRH